MLTYDELLDLGLSHGKTHVQAVGKLVKTNENQSIRIQKFNPIFGGKDHLGLLLTQNSLQWSSEDHHGIIKV